MAEARGWARDADPTYAEVLGRAEYEPRGSWVARFDGGYSPIVGSSRLAVQGSCLAQGLDARVVRWGRGA